MFLGLRTVIYPTANLAASREWYRGVLGLEPYFDEPFYVGFNVGGFELGLDPAADTVAGAVTYWGVEDAEAALAQLLAAGAERREELRDVGNGIRIATVRDPSGMTLGIIENPHFGTDPTPDGD